ncbi:13843_t:CDS:2 [Dentiscutata erythropus]|uniref:13843_t:CDS:1 n=1 Tax=Dentiscutata erythropus TaxID=1348616 RepID=A0A9N9A2D3_9GLOM|nr:13843_t:CDS:2 [Dentiscutata erythropus]
MSDFSVRESEGLSAFIKRAIADRVNESFQDDEKTEINDPSEYSLKGTDMELEIGEISMNIKEIVNGSENSFASNASELNRLNYETHPQAFYISRPIDTQEIVEALNLNGKYFL